jgi:hypothetical protein
MLKIILSLIEQQLLDFVLFFLLVVVLVLVSLPMAKKLYAVGSIQT